MESEGTMSLALWSVLIAGMLPYITVVFAKRSGGGYDNAAPREWAKTLEGERQRAYAAHQNHFEFFPFFASAVIIAEMRTGGSMAINTLALFAVACRIAYTAMYIKDRPGLRSLVWGFAILAIFGLFALAAAGK